MIQFIAWAVAAVVGGLVADGCAKKRERPEGRRTNNDDPCAECHTSPKETDPSEFQFFDDGQDVVHTSHLRTTRTNPMMCSKCHPIPTSLFPPLSPDSILHLDGRTDVSFGENVGSFNSQEKSCEVYCHGDRAIAWTPQALSCGSCHRETDPKHDTDDLRECGRCHDRTVDGQGNIISKDLHINGSVDLVDDVCAVCHDRSPHKERANGDAGALALLDNCQNCHPVPTSPFRQGATDTHKNGRADLKDGLCRSCHDHPPNTGAHAAHANPTISITAVACGDCHRVPSENDGLIEHLIREDWPPVVLGGLATRRLYSVASPAPMYNMALKQCLNVYCHGGGLDDFRLAIQPLWDDTSHAAMACDACHGAPPVNGWARHYPVEDRNCVECHPALPDKHINGAINLR